MEMIIEPLVDFEARVVCLSARTPVSVLVDRLLRLQSAPQWREPITLYLLGDDEGGSKQRTLSALEFLMLYSVIRALRSAVHGVALGLHRGFEPLLLAACQRGNRLLLPTAMACVGPFEIEELPLSNAPVGLAPHPGQSLREQAKGLVHAQLNHILIDLGLDRSLWQEPRVLTAGGAIKAGIADAIVPVAELSKKAQPKHVPER
jgi:hypothetical protein